MVLEKQCGIACPDYGSPYCDDCWEEWETKQEAPEDSDPAWHGPDIQKPYKDFYRR